MTRRGSPLSEWQESLLSTLSQRPLEVPGHGYDHDPSGPPVIPGYYAITVERALWHGWIEITDGHARITVDGRRALAEHYGAPRLLTPAARPGHTEKGYTDDPALAWRGEAEAVDEAWQDRFSELGRRRDQSRVLGRIAKRREERSRLKIAEWVELVKRDARVTHTDVSEELRLVRMLVAQGRESAARGRLAKLEGMLGRRAA